MKTPYKGFWTYALVLPGLVVLLDQISKYWIIDFLDVPYNICEIDPHPNMFHELSPVFDLALVCNRGVSFGLLGGDSPLTRWGLTLFAVIMVGVIGYILSSTKGWWARLSLSLIIGGAIGNAIDRFLNGAVTDFISVYELIPFFPWVFNIADSAITLGVIGLILSGFFFGEPNDADQSETK